MKITRHESLVASRQSGQTLIEVIIAVGLVVLVLLTLVSALTLAVRNNQFAKDQVLARNRSREALEWLRNMRDQMGWDSFYAVISADGNPVDYCLPSLPADVTSMAALTNQVCTKTDVISGTKFVRDLVLTVVSVDEIDATVTVAWTEGSKDHSSNSTLQMMKAL